MKKSKKNLNKFALILRYFLATFSVLIGIRILYERIAIPYDPQGAEIMLFSEAFRNLHNGIMLSYLGTMLPIFQLAVGILLFTKKYWLIGLLIYSPIAFNIFCIHIFYDIPWAFLSFFIIGIFVSVSTFLLIFFARDHLKGLIIKKQGSENTTE